MSTLIPPYVPVDRVDRIVPFSYRDGETYLSILERIGRYLHEFREAVLSTYTEVDAHVSTEVDRLISQVNSAIADGQTLTDQKLADITQQFADWFTQQIENNDEITSGLIEDMSSSTRSVLIDVIGAVLGGQVVAGGNVSVVQGADWGVSWTVANGIATLSLTVPPGAVAWDKTSTAITEATDISTLTPGIYRVPNSIVAGAHSIPIPGVSYLTIIPLSNAAGNYSALLQNTGYDVERVTTYNARRDASGVIGAWETESWVKRSLTTGEDLNNLIQPGEYSAAPYSVSSTLVNDWSPFTGSVIVHPQYSYGTTGTRFVIQERIVGATETSPVRRAWRAMRGSGEFSEWVEDRAEAIAYADGRFNDAINYINSLIPAEADRFSITAFGDSLTDGGANGEVWPEVDSWPSKLAAELGANYSVTNAGYSGATIDEMLMRVGARPVNVVIPAGGIAHASSAVVEPRGTYGMTTVRRAIALSHNGSGVQLVIENGVWTLHNWSGATIPAGRTTLNPPVAIDGVNADTAVVWVGINDITFGVTGNENTVADHIVAGHTQIVEWLAPSKKNVLILGVTPRSNESSTSTNGMIVQEINNRLRAMYPGKFASVLEYLQGEAFTDMGITPTPDDLTAIADGRVPPTMLADITHITKEAAEVVGSQFVRKSLIARGWIG